MGQPITMYGRSLFSEIFYIHNTYTLIKHIYSPLVQNLSELYASLRLPQLVDTPIVILSTLVLIVILVYSTYGIPSYLLPTRLIPHLYPSSIPSADSLRLILIPSFQSGFRPSALFLCVFLIQRVFLQSISYLALFLLIY